MSEFTTYEAAVTRARKQGSLADDAAQMAGFCANALQIIVGAVSPKLVREGAQATGLSDKDLMKLAASDSHAVAELHGSDARR